MNAQSDGVEAERRQPSSLLPLTTNFSIRYQDCNDKQIQENFNGWIAEV